MTNSFNDRLLVKFLIEELNSEELTLLMDWRARSEENERLFTCLIQLRLSRRFLQYNTPEKIDSALDVINRRIDRRERPFGGRLKFLRYVAAIGLIVLLFYGWNYTRQSETSPDVVVRSEEGIKKIVLDDGTNVWLNKGTTLRIPESFSAVNRQVTVDGEVYFEVKTNPDFPFEVKTRYLNLKVHGTSFNLKTGEENIETVLVTGKVVLEDNDRHFLFTVSPGEKVSFTPENNEFIVETVEVDIRTAWHLDQLKFESASLREITGKLSVLYNVNINLESEELAEYRFRCIINRDESLTDVLDLIEYMVPVSYQIEGREVFIYERIKY